MASSWSNLANNLSEEIHKFNSGMTMKNVKQVELNVSFVTVFLNIKTLKMI